MSGDPLAGLKALAVAQAVVVADAAVAWEASGGAVERGFVVRKAAIEYASTVATLAKMRDDLAAFEGGEP